MSNEPSPVRFAVFVEPIGEYEARRIIVRSGPDPFKEGNPIVHPPILQ
jgi:hypothetical protein